MNGRIQLHRVLLTVAALAATGPVAAATMTFEILDILPDDDLHIPDVGQTYTGTGYVTLQPPQGQFLNAFAIQGTGGIPNAQVDIAALSGATINSASMSFFIENTQGQAQQLRIGAYDSGGLLGMRTLGPFDYGLVVSSVTLGSNAYDVTGLVANAVLAGETWLGFMLDGNETSHYTLTLPSMGGNADSARFRLVVDYTTDTNPVPEPPFLALLALGVAGLGLSRRRQV